MTCTRPQAENQKSLDPWAPSTHDPTVWTGRALQAECEKMEGVGLAHLYPALAWSVCAPGHHGYPRAPDLEKGPERPLGSPDHVCDGETVSPSPQIQLADLGRYSCNIPRLRQGSALDFPSAGPNALILCDLWF